MQRSNTSSIGYLLTLQVIVIFSIFFDIPFVRQIIGFAFFAVVPGYLILKLIDANRDSVAETIVFSVGVSIAFLTFIGVLVNELGSFGFLFQPLSTYPMTIASNIAVLLLIIGNYLGKRNLAINTSLSNLWSCLLFLILPILSILGVLSIRSYNDNLPLIITILSIAVIVVVSVLSWRFSSKFLRYYPLILFSLVLALLLSVTLISNYQYGTDIQSEYNTFISTKIPAFWNLQNNNYWQQSSDNAMLSLTVFPTVLSNLLGIDAAWIFKLLYPIFFSLVPVGLYLLYRQYWTERTAFLSSVFFVANFSFLTIILAEAKQMLAELFFVILLLTLFTKNKTSDSRKWVVFIIAFFGILVSHYSMSYMFLLFISVAFVGQKIFSKTAVTKIRATFVIFAFSLTFFWYVYVVQASYGAGPYSKFVGVIQSTTSNFFTEFFSSESRGLGVQTAIGLVSIPSPLHRVGTLLYDLTIFLIIIGFIFLLFKWQKKQFDSTFLASIGGAMALLVAAVAVPNFSGQLELGRLYEILLLFLSPLFILGCLAIFNLFSRLKASHKISVPNISNSTKEKGYSFVIVLLILIPFFVFQTGLLYEVTNDPVPTSVVLSYQKMYYSYGLIHERDVFSAGWLSRYGIVDSKWTFTDRQSLDTVLNSYSTIDRSMLILLANTTGKYIAEGTYIREDNSFDLDTNSTYIYFSQFNAVKGIITWDFATNTHFKNSQIPVLNNTGAFVNRVYSNGAGEIDFRVPIS
jgi:uncharacterized membrane protein